MNAIVSVCADWAIGLNNDLLIPNKVDMRHFVTMTRGATVIMGRKTLESFPGGPLKGRRNIVISRNPSYSITSPADTNTTVELYTSFEEALSHVASHETCWLIGGASLYRTYIDRCEYVYVTMHDTIVPADTYFPNLDEDPAWELVSTDPQGVTPEGIAFEYRVYKQRS